MRCFMRWSNRRSVRILFVALLVPFVATAQVPSTAPSQRGPSMNAVQLQPLDAALGAPARLSASERAALIEELKPRLPDFTDRLRLSAKEEQQILGLLLDGEIVKGAIPNGSAIYSNVVAGDAERRVKQIRKLLGRRFALYQEYFETLAIRRRVVAFDAELAATDQLQPQQKERLIELLRANEQQLQERLQQQTRPRGRAALPDDPAEAELAARRFDVERKQYDFVLGRALTRLQLERVPEVLTPAQLEVFSRIETQRLAAEQAYVEDLRVAAGMDRAIPE